MILRVGGINRIMWFGGRQTVNGCGKNHAKRRLVSIFGLVSDKLLKGSKTRSLVPSNHNNFFLEDCHVQSVLLQFLFQISFCYSGKLIQESWIRVEITQYDL